MATTTDSARGYSWANAIPLLTLLVAVFSAGVAWSTLTQLRDVTNKIEATLTKHGERLERLEIHAAIGPAP